MEYQRLGARTVGIKPNAVRYMCHHRDKEPRGTKNMQNYILYYTGVSRSKWASAGVAILLKRKWEGCVHSYAFINDRIKKLRLKCHVAT
jgi:hypothetical protein